LEFGANSGFALVGVFFLAIIRNQNWAVLSAVSSELQNARVAASGIGVASRPFSASLSRWQDAEIPANRPRQLQRQRWFLSP
jgi:hypothetical protein